MSAMFSMIVLRMKAYPQHSTGKEGVTISLNIQRLGSFRGSLVSVRFKGNRGKNLSKWITAWNIDILQAARCVFHNVGSPYPLQSYSLSQTPSSDKVRENVLSNCTFFLLAQKPVPQRNREQPGKYGWINHNHKNLSYKHFSWPVRQGYMVFINCSPNHRLSHDRQNNQ